MTFYPMHTRYVPLDDISIRSDGTGRTVEAYASVFGERQEIRDAEGHYFEVIAPTAFDRSLGQRTDFPPMYNHGRTMYGTPSERFSMPLGRTVSIEADGYGLRTVAEYNKTPLADEVLELIRSDSVTGMSFSGGFVETDRQRAETAGDLPTFTRTEIALREYGPTPFPAYEAARIAGVRSEAAEMLASMTIEELSDYIASLPEPARDDLSRAIAAADPGTGDISPLDPQHEVAHHNHERAAAVMARVRLTLRKR